jgi:hypothetical protein
MTYSSKFLVSRFFTVLVLMVVCGGSAFSQRMYDSIGRQTGRVEVTLLVSDFFTPAFSNLLAMHSWQIVEF